MRRELIPLSDVGVIDLDNLTPELNALLNETALEIRGEFNGLIEEMSLPNLRDVDWIVSTLASRNKYYSPLFIRCCRLALLQRVIREGSGLRVVILADRPLADLLREYFRREQLDITVRCTEGPATRAWRLLRPFRQYALAVWVLCLRFLARSPARRSRSLPAEPIVLIDTFVLNNGGDEGSIVNGEYKDRYYSGLWNQLTDDERRLVFFAPTILGLTNAWKAFRLVRDANVPFLVHDDYLSAADYFNVLGHPFRVLRLKVPDVRFRGFDLRRLVGQERCRNCSDFINLLGILYYRFAARLAQHGVRVRLLIDWYENQVLDRGLIVGFHRFHPETKIIGYQGYVVAAGLHFYTHPNRTEKLGGAAPDVVAVTGRGLEDDMREFCDDVQVDVAPGFRFQRLWRDRHAWPDPARFSILVALPIGLDDSAHILGQLLKALRILQSSDVVVSVKPHPTKSPEQIKHLVPGPWPEAFELVTGDFHDCLERSNLVITNASSVSLEALAKGVRVIIVAPDTGILQNPIPSRIHPERWTVCNDAGDLARGITRFRAECRLAPSGRENEGEDVREMFFEPVTRQTVAKFLELS